MSRNRVDNGALDRTAESSDDERISTRRVKSRPNYVEIDEPSEEEDTKSKTTYSFERNGTDKDEITQNEEKAEEEDVPDETEDSPEEDNDKEEEYIDEDDEDDEDFSKPRSRRRPKTGRRSGIVSDDSEFHDSDAAVSEDDDFVEKLNERNFIASDDEGDVTDDYGYGDAPPKKRRKRQSRSTSVEPSTKRLTRSQAHEKELQEEVKSSDSDTNSIQKEIEELYDSSPVQTPIKYKLRDREQKVDYTIPPPISNDAQFENSFPTAPMNRGRGRGRKPDINKNEYRKLLFPTAGPFGGSDVLSLFGTNIPPGGIPIPGMPNNSLGAIGQNVSDSDSSDDEVAPINGEATIKLSKGAIGALKPITDSLTEPAAKKKNKLSDTDPLGVDMSIDFNAVGGLDNYINQLKEMVALPLMYPELYQNFHITPPRGVLFHGPPGTGKTLMARALAASCSSSNRKTTFFMRKGADCLSKWVGEAERQLRLLFEEAKNQQPSIIFFDEIDGLAPVRSSKQEQIHASIVSTLLALMDGMDNRGQVIVIGATNRPDSVDPALRRPGRFDREFYFPLPDMSARAKILEIHTRKWTPPLQSEFVQKIAELTKGYGGADLRALCTEAALNSIQRKYPQIYGSNDKLKIKPSKIKVIATDFMKAIEKIVPSSARSTSSGSAPLPDNIRPLLESVMNEITSKLDSLIPGSIAKKKITTLDEAHYFDPSVTDDDGGFRRQQLLKNLENSRIFKPHLLICGEQGSGQQYLTSAVLNYLEGFQVQSLDFGCIFGDSTRTPESAIVQAVVEAKRHQPSVLFIPNIDLWFQVVPFSAKASLTGLLRNLKTDEKILLLGVSESPLESLDSDLRLLFGFNNYANNVNIVNPNREERQKYFSSLKQAAMMKPHEFINDLSNRPKRKLKELKVIKQEIVPDTVSLKKKNKQQEQEDTKLKNILKIKLAGLMDLFKNRYKRFKKPIIDESFLYHLLDPSILQNPLNNYEVLYVKSDDPAHVNMIRELSTNKYYNNMDLDIIEERLWNGYYSEPKQFLKDIKMIVKDSITSGDRERILKANEMLTNAQFGVDEFSTPEFVEACRKLREREMAKNETLLKKHEELLKQIETEKRKNAIVVNDDPSTEDHLQNGQLIKDNAVFPKDATESETEKANGDTTEQQTSNGVVHEEQPEPKINGSTEKIAEPEPEPELDSESEEEVGFETSQKELVLPDGSDRFFTEALPDMTENYNVEKLEIVMARLVDIIWSHRNQWDKTSTFKALEETARHFKAFEKGRA